MIPSKSEETYTVYAGGPDIPYAVLESDRGRIIIRSWTQYEYLAMLPDHFAAAIEQLWIRSASGREAIRRGLAAANVTVTDLSEK
jgi:hypothetical protein